MATKLTLDDELFLIRADAYYEVLNRPIRTGFQTNLGCVISAKRRAGLAGMPGPHGHAQHWSRNQRAREALTQAGLMAHGELTSAGRREARSWLWPYRPSQLREACRRIAECVRRGWCRPGGLAPEVFVAGSSNMDELAELQAVLLPALIDGWLQSRSTTQGQSFYGIVDGTDVESAIRDSLPSEFLPREEFFETHENEVRNFRRSLASETERLQDVGELPLALGIGLVDATKSYDAGDFGALFPNLHVEAVVDPSLATIDELMTQSSARLATAQAAHKSGTIDGRELAAITIEERRVHDRIGQFLNA